MQDSEIILVGGSGKTGGRVADRLKNRGLDFRFASRSSARPFDWEKPAAWAAALIGAGTSAISRSQWRSSGRVLPPPGFRKT